jgi:hypothetical protein
MRIADLEDGPTKKAILQHCDWEKLFGMRLNESIKIEATMDDGSILAIKNGETVILKEAS